MPFLSSQFQCYLTVTLNVYKKYDLHPMLRCVAAYHLIQWGYLSEGKLSPGLLCYFLVCYIIILKPRCLGIVFDIVLEDAASECLNSWLRRWFRDAVILFVQKMAEVLGIISEQLVLVELLLRFFVPLQPLGFQLQLHLDILDELEFAVVHSCHPMCVIDLLMVMPAGDSKLVLTEDGEGLAVLVHLLLKPSLPQRFLSCLLWSNDCGCCILKCVDLGDVQRILPHDVSFGKVCHIDVLFQLLVSLLSLLLSLMVILSSRSSFTRILASISWTLK